MTFTEFLENHISKETVSFHMPGHKGRSVFDLHGMGALIDNLVDGDITEIPGSDNLSQPQGIIRNVMDRYKTLYGSEESFVSVGGSTLGLMASVLAVYSYGMYKSETIGDGRETAEAETEDETYEGGDSKKLAIAVARNSHKSIFNGIALSDADPIFIRPEIFDCGIVGEITAETVANAFSRAAEEERKICAVVVPNPNYYGICSPIKEIARVVHEHNAILIVDQAHGAHLRFMYPELSADICECGAITQGDRCAIGQGDCCARDMLDCADIVVESTHKTLASFTQTAIINVYNKELVSAVEEKVKLMQSTSPSYILMKSLDMNVELIENYGESLFESWRMNIDKTYTALDELGINYLEHPLHDRSKILIDMSGYGILGSELSEELELRGIITELDSGKFSMCMSGIGNARGDYERLIAALADIRDYAVQSGKGTCGESNGASEENNLGIKHGKEMTGVEAISVSPADAGNLFSLMNKERERVETPRAWEWVPASEAAGRVCAEDITPYPPGVPLILAGEIMDCESLAFATEYRGKGGKVFGITENMMVKVGK